MTGEFTVTTCREQQSLRDIGFVIRMPMRKGSQTDIHSPQSLGTTKTHSAEWQQPLLVHSHPPENQNNPPRIQQVQQVVLQVIEVVWSGYWM